MMVFDLDPGPPAAIAECCEVALILRDVLGRSASRLPEDLRLEGHAGLRAAQPTTSPTNGTKPFSQALARLLEAASGADRVEQEEGAPRGKVLVDWSQNDEHKTTVCVYSLRARERPTVSTPLGWDEVEAGDPDALVFEAGDVLERVEEHGDLFAPVRELEQQLPDL